MPQVVRKDLTEETIEVLTGLGYKRAEAKLKVEEALGRNPGVKDIEELIRDVFRAERESYP